MEKLKYLFVLLVALLILPFAVYAEDDDESTDDGDVEQTEQVEENKDGEESKEVKIYLFRGEGCPHCQEAEEWFDSIEEEYGDKFDIEDYETWKNNDNKELFIKVLKARGEYVSEEESLGVPYIVVGDKSWNGFTDSYKSEITDQINKMYEQNVSDRYDIMKYISSKKDIDKDEDSNDFAAVLLIVLAVGGIGYGIYRLRSTTE